MHSVAMASLALDTASQVGSRLPWGWYAGLTAIDAALVAVVLRQRGRRDDAPDASAPPRRTSRITIGAVSEEVALTGVVRRDGWVIPRERAASLPRHRQGAYAWPVHREYLRSRLG